MPHRTLTALSAAAGLVLLAAGCAAPAVKQAPAGGGLLAQVIASPGRYLQAGVTESELRTLFGEPASIQPVLGSEGRAVIWVYEHRIPQGNEVVSVKTENRPYVDPFTGQTREIPEPVYNTRSVTVIEQLRLVIRDGRLESWAPARQVERTIN